MCEVPSIVLNLPQKLAMKGKRSTQQLAWIFPKDLSVVK